MCPTIYSSIEFVLKIIQVQNLSYKNRIVLSTLRVNNLSYKFRTFFRTNSDIFVELFQLFRSITDVMKILRY